MKKNVKGNVLDLYSNNEEINNIIKEMKSNLKVYLKVLSALQILGHFNEKTEVEIYSCIEGDGRKIRLWCSDLEDNLFVFYAITNDKKEMLQILKVTNEKTDEYDLSLIKKFDVTSDNIELTKSGKTYNFKFGRLVTNDNNFYSIFMSGDIVYQIVGDFDKVLTSSIINVLNNFDMLPTLKEFINNLEIVLLNSSCSFSELKISAFKDGIRIGDVLVENPKIKESYLLKK